MLSAIEDSVTRMPAGVNVYWSARSQLEFALGDPAAAARSALMLADVPTAAVGVSCVIPWRLQAAIGLAASAEPARARTLLAEQRPITERWGLPRARGLLLRAAGLVVQDPSLLEQAAETLQETPARLELARTLIDLGAMLRRSNHRAAAREPLRAGLDLAHRCGAVPLEERAAAELAATGARPAARCSLASTRSPPPSGESRGLPRTGGATLRSPRRFTSRARPWSPTSGASTRSWTCSATGCARC